MNYIEAWYIHGSILMGGRCWVSKEFVGSGAVPSSLGEAASSLVTGMAPKLKVELLCDAPRSSPKTTCMSLKLSYIQGDSNT
jgi:hypothetical protein